MLTCDLCNQDFKNRAGLGKHRKTCDGSRKEPKWMCPKCNFHIHSKRTRHVEICDGLGPNAHKRRSNKGLGRGWSRGTQRPEIGAKISISLRGRKWQASTPEIESQRRAKISASMRLNPNAGGYRRGSGVGKKTWYASQIAGRVHLDSSYELRFAQWLDKLSIHWSRNEQRFQYLYEEKLLNYIPDFQVGDVYVEVKGFITERDRAKWKSFPHKLVIVQEHDLIKFESGEVPKWS